MNIRVDGVTRGVRRRTSSSQSSSSSSSNYTLFADCYHQRYFFALLFVLLILACVCRKKGERSENHVKNGNTRRGKQAVRLFVRGGKLGAAGEESFLRHWLFFRPGRTTTKRGRKIVEHNFRVDKQRRKVCCESNNNSMSSSA
jgi:hypothetical protein